MVDDLLMPILGLITGGVDFSSQFVVLREGAKAAAPYASLQAAKDAGAVTVNYGLFVNSILTFLFVAFAVFMLIRAMNRLRREQPAKTKACTYCATDIPAAATRCPHCTSQLAA
jgi:large conductance mechanosensitive channel